MRILHVLAAITVVASARPVVAQAPEPPRPELPRGADPNDWEAYFDEGTRLFDRFPGRAADAFYWAARLDPSRAEPLFARWAAFYAQDWGRWLWYVDEDERLMRLPEVVAHEDLREMAYRRNPFVHRAFEAALWSRLGRRLRWDGATRAFMSYGAGEFRAAADGFGRAIRANPDQAAALRYWRALAFVGGRQVDSAAVEVTRLLATLRQRDDAQVADVYESKALLEYVLGLLHEAGNRPAEARRAYERALEEDLAMYPARAALARLALLERRVSEAVEQLAQAVEVAPEDAVMRYEHGHALLSMRRWDEAAAAFQRAAELEPHWADPYLWLGRALERAAQPGKARDAYRAYVERAPRRRADDVHRANERLAALGQGG